MERNKLRIGVLLDNDFIPLWKYKMLEQIVQSEHSQIVLAIKKEKRLPPPINWSDRITRKFNSLGFSLTNKLEKRLFKPEFDPFEKKSFNELGEIPKLLVQTKETKFSDYLHDDSLEKIRSYDLDVLIRVGFRILRGEILNVARHGVWSYHHGNNRTNRGGPAGFWEVYEGRDETGVVLQRLTEDLDGGIVLSRAFYATNKDSFNRNRNSFYWKAMVLLPRELKKLYELGEEKYYQQIANTDDPYFYDYPLYQAPSNRTVLKYVLRNYSRRILEKFEEKLYFKQWVIIFNFSSKPGFCRSLFRYRKLVPPKDRFWADPFPYERNGKYYIFCEEFMYKTKKGHISVIEIDKRGNYKESEVVLDKDYHLSYPFLFEENGELFMIPESGQNKTIEIYKCSEFPLKWEFQAFLMTDIHAADSTIYKKDGIYWLFCNVKENVYSSTHDELHLFYSNSLISQDWTPHPQNPVISNVHLSRPAGNLFEIDQTIYRPSQGSAKTYGHHLNLNKIVTLNKNKYNEKLLQRISPLWDKKVEAIHTINNYKNLSVSDVQISRRRYF